ncbi:PREDICTED: NAC transcription factor NAM-2-like [Fragaria vesca subsp. vesca]
MNRIRDENIYNYHPRTLAGNESTPKDLSLIEQGGYWKATKRDETIKTQGGEEIGYKMHLDFYDGTHAQGTKTNWKMHEYRINEENGISSRNNNNKGEGSSRRLDEWVLYKIYINKNFKADTNNHSSKTPDNFEVVLPVTNVTMTIKTYHQLFSMKIKINLATPHSSTTQL